MRRLAELTPTKIALHIKFRKVTKKIEELEALLLELNRHPEATPEMVLDAQRTYARLSARLREIEGELRARGVPV